MPARKSKLDKTVLAAIIGAFGIVLSGSIGAYFGYLGAIKPVEIPIEYTRTAKAEQTQAAYIAATSTAVVQQNLESFTISIVLPGSHTAPDVQGNAIPGNDATSRLANRIQIPSISVDAPIVQGEGWDDLKRGVGQKLGTANPGENGFIVLSAYNDIYGELFRYLDRLKQDDTIILFTKTNQYIYFVDRLEIVENPVLDLSFRPNESMLVLTSSYPYLQNDKWIIVYALLK